MWSSFMGLIPSGLVVLCTLLSYVVPLGIYAINQTLHKYGDPPWMQTAVPEQVDQQPANYGEALLKENE
ncbi:hypothetical protein BC351_22760 [Paenibacillus ferrarius]|uniref:Uncharacterized protein n=1 Tax=Paenibacillus ferrarius TaxID=1469647 RepID=A0A1V4HM86_9BACL|nr:hypothetical protein [Paenibacillus ferrarius]OPH58633.1 hypothetical protein BC351_22760 [Paenibacillus ferrarius]